MVFDKNNMWQSTSSSCSSLPILPFYSPARHYIKHLMCKHKRTDRPWPQPAAIVAPGSIVLCGCMPRHPACALLTRSSCSPRSIASGREKDESTEKERAVRTEEQHACIHGTLTPGRGRRASSSTAPSRRSGSTTPAPRQKPTPPPAAHPRTPDSARPHVVVPHYPRARTPRLQLRERSAANNAKG